MAKKICVLTIAGSDSGSGAGIQSDLKTFKNHGLYGVNVITSVTAQNTKGVQSSYELSAGIIDEQLKSIFGDFNVKAVKTGMLSSAKVIDIVAKHLKRKKVKLVIDPIILSKNGFALLNKEGIKHLKTKLVALAYVITPNIPETEELTGIEINTMDDLETAAVILKELGAKNVVLKGGHMKMSTGLPKGTDILFDGKKFYMFNSEYINTKNTHGIGCTFSAAITSNLALGKSLIESIAYAKNYISKALKKTVKIGHGFSPVEQ